MTLSLRSPAFEDGTTISAEYGYTDQNVNPPLDIDGVPADATSLALIVDDPDAREPAGKVWDHWIVWNVNPETERIPEAWDPAEVGAVEGENDFGDQGYGGPNPPDREHTYRFELYALDDTLDLSPRSGADDLREAIEGHVLEEAQLEGTYAP